MTDGINLARLRVLRVILAGAGLYTFLFTGCRSGYFPIAPIVTDGINLACLRVLRVILAGAGLHAFLFTGCRSGYFPITPIVTRRNRLRLGCAAGTGIGHHTVCVTGRLNGYRSLAPAVQAVKYQTLVLILALMPFYVSLSRGIRITVNGSGRNGRVDIIFKDLTFRIVDGDILQRLVRPECLLADRHNARWNVDGLQILTTIKSARANLRYLLRQDDQLDHVLIFLRAVPPGRV